MRETSSNGWDIIKTDKSVHSGSKQYDTAISMNTMVQSYISILAAIHVYPHILDLGQNNIRSLEYITLEH